MKQLGNLFTILSLFCGFFSIIFSLEGFFMQAAYAIILSFVLDGLDGQIARSNNCASEFGKELDSLVDVVCFGVAPVVLGEVMLGQIRILSLAVFFFYLSCAVIRLAKYNICTKDSRTLYFNGLPTTVSAGVLASFVLVSQGETLFLAIAFLLSVLMVSSVKYPNIDGLFRLLGSRIKMLLLALVSFLALSVYFCKEGIFIFIIFLIYLIFSPFMVKRLNNA